MNRTGSTSSQRSYVLEVGVIIGGLLELIFRHDGRIVAWRIVMVLREQKETHGKRLCSNESGPPQTHMTKRL